MWLGGSEVKQTEFDDARGKDIDRLFVFFCQDSLLRSDIYATCLRFCCSIPLLPPRFLSKNSSTRLWQYVQVDRPNTKISRCCIFRWQKTRNLTIVYTLIVDLRWRILLQIPINLIDGCYDWAKHGLLCNDKKLQKRLTSERKRRINDLYIISRSLFIAMVNSQY